MSETQFPPRGTMCADCGCCPATVYAGNDALCWECDEGNHGPRKTSPTTAVKIPTTTTTAVVKTSPPREEIPVREEIRAQVVPPAVPKAEPAPATPIQKEEPMSSHNRTKTPEHIRTAILAEDPSISSQQLADKYGVSYNTVWYSRKVAGIKVARPAAAAKKPKTVSPSLPRKKHAIVHHVTIDAPIALPDSRIAISGEITAAGADKFWSILSIEQKRQIVVASIQSILTAGKES